MGDSRGRWEGTTLVVDTTNFTAKTDYQGSRDNLHLVERFTRIDASMLEYAVTLEDPTAWTRPWTVKVEMAMQDQRANQIYDEPRCHDGNHAMTAMLIATCGIYGLMAYAVTQRRREIGVRMALGAERRDVLRLVLARALRIVVAGLIVGLAGAVGVTRVLQRFLFGVTPTDPIVFTIVTLLLLAVGLMAAWLPARRAARIDPCVALRAE